MSEYRLDDLGWYQFERLCQTLLKTFYGASVEAWGGTSSDLGRDAYSPGRLRYPDPKAVEDGPFVFQVKHVAEANAAGAHPEPALLNAVQKERRRIEDRLEEGSWDTPRFYTLLTNVALTADMRGQIAAAFAEALPDTVVLTQDAVDIGAMLDAQPAIRSSYPQVLGLRDLEALIRNAVAADVVTRSTLSLDSATELSEVFVATAPYHRALGVVGQHGFVVLTGPPEMGKTAIARIIALEKHTEGWEAYECRSSSDVLGAYSRERSQVFVADDAFGSTEYRPDLASEWAADLDRLLGVMDSNHWLLCTSRPGPLREGLSRLHLQGSARGFPAPGEVHVDTQKLSIAEKAQMLYRHTKAAGISRDLIDVVKLQATRIIHNEHFTPLRIARLVREQLPMFANASSEDRDELVRAAIVSGLEQPTTEMRTSLAALSEEHRALLFALLGAWTTPTALDSLEYRVVEYLGHPMVTAIGPLAELIDEHFIRIRRDAKGSANRVIDWVHPSVRDSVIEHLIEHDLERFRFLSTATYPAMLLALSIAGGPEGTLQLPLIRSDTDWGAANQRAAQLIETGDDEQRVAILEGLLAILSSEGGNPTSTAEVRAIAETTLNLLLRAWQHPDLALPVRMLDAYYRLSIRAGVLVPAPDLRPTWTHMTDAAARTVADVRGELTSFDEWLNLVSLLRWAEPRFLAIVGFPEAALPLFAGFLDALEASLSQLEDLEEEENEDMQMDGEDVTIPVEPSDEETEDKRWLDRLEPIVDAVRQFVPDQNDRVDTLTKMEQQASYVREQRAARWWEFESYEPEDEDWRDRVRESDSFDINSFFSDL
jgi:hypothetical protein